MKKKISKAVKKIKFRKAKKAMVSFTVALATMMAMTTTAFASGTVDASGFVSKAEAVLKSIVILIGAGLALWGIVNLLESYGSDNAGSKSQGIKQLVAGLGLILVGIVLVPVLGNMMSGAL